MKNNIWENKTAIETAVKGSKNKTETLRILGFSTNGNYARRKLQESIDNYNIDCSHFTAWKKWGTYNCLSCGKETKAKPGITRANKFCSHQCQRDYEWKNITKPKIYNGEIKATGSTAALKFLIERDGYKCNACNISEWNDGYIILDIDHIDGNNDNNYPDNWRFLCPNCHRQTLSWGNKTSGEKEKYIKRLIIECKT